MIDGKPRKVIFCPHPGPQTAFVQSPIFETVFGGARGGGLRKTYACLGEFIIHSQEYGRLAKGLFLRRTRESLKDAIREAKVLFRGIAEWKSTRNEFWFHSGAVLVFNYLDKDEDAEQYQGHQYTRIYIEELTQFPDPAPVFKMFATLRSADGVPCQFRASCNPGGPGHNWVKSRYVDIGAYNVVTDSETGSQRVFIPARIIDNPTLMRNDPDYVNRLRMVGNDQLVKAWLEGDWSIIEGAYFSEWNKAKHVVPQQVFDRLFQSDWRVFSGGDWGSAHPFSFGWYAIVPDTVTADGYVFPRGGLVRFREFYGCKAGEFNKGLKWTAEQVGREFVRRTREPMLYGVLDPAAFSQNGGPSIAERLANVGARFRPADNKRIARRGSIGGWDMMRQRLSGDDGVPMLVFTDGCPHAIRTIPVIQHDSTNMEDLDTDSEDHVADEVRYACMSRPWVSKKPSSTKTNPFSVQNAFWKDVLEPKQPERVRL